MHLWFVCTPASRTVPRGALRLDGGILQATSISLGQGRHVRPIEVGHGHGTHEHWGESEHMVRWVAFKRTVKHIVLLLDIERDCEQLTRLH